MDFSLRAFRTIPHCLSRRSTFSDFTQRITVIKLSARSRVASFAFTGPWAARRNMDK